MSDNSIRPEDFLADGVDNVVIKGQQIRKGTVGAFLANIERFENTNNSKQQRNEAMNMLIELAPAIITAGLHKHVIFRNPEIEKLFS